ncbi:uncharacterized protein JCM6883_005792 [Sporobolomyces salmoneus]|uniref:uncharacterized protein n=1 Tax=Sporobolomyces salmoneus TaxID=183962 RepID=UPI003172EAAD
MKSFVETIAFYRDVVDAYAKEHWIFVCVQLAILSGLFFYFLHHRFPLDPSAYTTDNMEAAKATLADAAVKTADTLVSKPDEAQLDPPKDTPFTKAELAKYNGSDESTPIYVAIKGKIYDVSAKRDMYGPGCGYNVFTGKDASKALGKSSLKAEDADSDYSSLTDEELKVLDDWEKYFAKRYNIVGKVVD